MNKTLEQIIDEYLPIITDEWLNAIDECETLLEEFIFENYPEVIDEIKPSSEIEDFAEQALETQLSQGFERELSALADKAQIPIVLLLDLLGKRIQIPKFELILNYKNELSKIQKKSISISNNSKRKILDSIGLTPNQTKSLNTFRDALTEIARTKQTGILSSNQIRLLSASQRTRIRSALEKGIDENDVEDFVKAQRKALLINRAKALTNEIASKTAHSIQQGVIDTAINLNLIKPNEYRRFWVTMHDEKVRFAHTQTESMNSKGVGLQQPFNTPLGPRMNPPLEINCRCVVNIRRVTNG